MLIFVGFGLTVGTLVLAAVAWRQRETPGARAFLWVASAARTSWETVDTDDARLEVRDDAVIEADRDALLRILENLIRNSVEHAVPPDRDPSVSPDGGTSEVGADGDDSPDDDPFSDDIFGEATNERPPECTITVGVIDDGFYLADDGVGIDEPERVFDRGYTTAADGTGLGLAIVERAVESHGWTITAANQPDSGARFEVHDVNVVDSDASM